jgi:hypothetical protein
MVKLAFGRIVSMPRSGLLIVVRLTEQALSCAARAHMDTAERHAACLHMRRAMQAA